MRQFQKITDYIKDNRCIILLIIVILFAFLTPVYLDYLIEKQTDKSSKLLTNYDMCDIVTVPPAKPLIIDKTKKYAFKINNQFIVLDRNSVYEVVYKYIQQNIVVEKRNDKAYIDKLTNSYISLMDTEDPNTVLRFIGLCRIESNFNNKDISSAGAYGIGQVMLKVWSKVMKDNWNISTDDYKKDINKQIIVAYKIYNVYLKKNKNDVAKAHKGYSGGAKGYHNKVIKQYDKLKTDIHKQHKLAMNN